MRYELPRLFPNGTYTNANLISQPAQHSKSTEQPPNNLERQAFYLTNEIKIPKTRTRKSSDSSARQLSDDQHEPFPAFGTESPATAESPGETGTSPRLGSVKSSDVALDLAQKPHSRDADTLN